MLVIPAFKACMQSALIRANIKPPVELVVANLVTYSMASLMYIDVRNTNTYAWISPSKISK